MSAKKVLRREPAAAGTPDAGRGAGVADAGPRRRVALPLGGPPRDGPSRRRLQQAMVRGAVTREAYIAWMREMLHLHGALERALRRLRESDARVRKIVSDDQFRAGDIRHCFADISKAVRLLGYSPKFRFETGIAELVGWVKAQRVAADKLNAALAEARTRGIVA